MIQFQSLFQFTSEISHRSQCQKQNLFLKMAESNLGSLRNFVENGRKILGASMNYPDVVKEKGEIIPTKPIIFQKPTSSYIREGQQIVLPKIFSNVLHEVELGVIIGKRCKNISKEEAMDYVGGYCLALDLTATSDLNEAEPNREPWTFSKGFDTSTPVSRFIQTCEVRDPHNLSLWLCVNGEKRHGGNTKDLIFNIPYLISYLSQHMTLEPSDLILTGTPSGSATLKPGDVLKCGLGNVVKMKFNVVKECLFGKK